MFLLLMLVMAEVEEVQDAVTVVLFVFVLLSFLLEVVWDWLLLPCVRHMVMVEGVGHGVLGQRLGFLHI